MQLENPSGFQRKASFRSFPPAKLLSWDYHVKSKNSISSHISILVTLPIILHLTNHPTNKTELSTKRDFFARRRFRPVPLTEVSLADIKGQLASR